jgi:uroporphyrinogen decarboxylase
VGDGMTEGADHPFLAACRGEVVPYPPVWFMRQAGRALPEYRQARGDTSILESLRSPEVAAELTLQPVRRYGVDAAILFSDIVVPLAAIGFGIEIHAGVGPVAAEPFTCAADLGRLRPLEPEADIPYVLETIRILRRELAVPLIGFAGAPFTLASYLIEGGASRDHAKTKALMYSDPDLWAALLDRLADIALSSLQAQIAAGAQAIQLFDSWVGTLNPGDYRRFVLPASARVLGGLADFGVPRIHFGVGTGELLSAMRQAGADVVGVDWRVTLDQARQRVGPGAALQGNLDPAVVLAGWDVTRPRAEEILAAGGGHGHIFNLGHGVLPQTDPDVLSRLVDLCHSWRPAR